MKLDVQAMEYQQEALFDFETPIVGVSGGKRSGKSRMITCAKSIIASSIHRGHEFVVASPTYGMTRRNLLPIYRELAQEWKLDIKGLEVKAPSELLINWGGVTSKLILDVTIENYERMNGLSLAGGFVDEIDKARHEDATNFLEELLFRCSNPAHGRPPCINITGAPELNGALGEFFVENATPEKKLYTWSMLQNTMISDEYKARILSTIPLNKRKAWVDGELMFNADGLAYDCYDPVQNNTTLTIANLLPGERVLVSFDINLGGTSAVLILEREKKLYVVGEWMKLKDTKAVLDKIALQPWKDSAVITCDPAMTQVGSYIAQARVKHNIMRSAPEIDHRVTAVNLQFCNALDVRNLFVNRQTCPILVKCLSRQGFVGGIPDKKTFIEQAGTDISGPIDALGYGVFLLRPFDPRNSNPIRLRGL
jgi:hypothetical protein